MTLRDADIIDSVNKLALEDRNRLIEFIGVTEVDADDVDALLAASESKKAEEKARN